MSRASLLLRWGFAVGAFATLASASGCKGHHDALAPDGGAGGATSSSKSVTAATGTGTGGSGGSLPQEPEVPTRFTFVNGVVDAPTIRFCFAPYPEGALDRPPFPSAGLAFGTAYTAPTGTMDIPAADALVIVVAGDAGNATCAELTADPSAFPDVTLLEMGLVPKDALAKKRSFLVVADGCLGGVTHTDVAEKQICGTSYTPTTPTAGLALLAMSLLDEPSHVAMQYVNAVAAMPKANVWIQPSFAGVTPIVLVNGGPFGGSAPYPPNVSIEVSEIGSVAGAAIGTAVNPSPAPTSSIPLSTTLAGSGLGNDAVSNGRSLVFVGVGAAPGTMPAPAPDAWWKAYTVVAIDPYAVAD